MELTFWKNTKTGNFLGYHLVMNFKFLGITRKLDIQGTILCICIVIFLTVLKEKDQSKSQNESMDLWSKPLRFFLSILLTT